MKKSFTLIELLVVISIINFMASIVLATTREARLRARDARRLADMRQLITVLDLYYDKFGVYPGTTASYGEEETSAPNNCGGWDSSTVDNNNDGIAFLTPLVTNNYLRSSPRDPISTIGPGCSGYTYRYYLYPAGYASCDPNGGDFYILVVNDFETSTGPASSSPGFSCPGRNWQAESDWVTGRFTNK